MKAVGKWVLIEVEQQEENGILVEEGNRGKIVSYGADCCFVKDIAEGIMTALHENGEMWKTPPEDVFIQGSAENPFIGAECYFSPRNAIDIQGLKCVRDADVFCVIPLVRKIEMDGDTLC